VKADGEAVCWGWDTNGRATPPPGARFSAIAAGSAHSCGVGEFGNLVCWGRNELGQSEPRDGPFSALALGMNHTCALRTDGSAFCQGNDSHGQASPPPTVFAQIAAGDRQTCGITSAGGLECWGISPLSDYSEKFASVSVGYGRIFVLTADGVPKSLSGSPPDEGSANGAWLSSPVEMFPLPAGGGVAVVDLGGYIEIYPPDGGEPRIALDLIERTRCCYGESGMFGAALDPDFARFPFIYVYWQTDGGDVFEGRVSRFPMTRGGEIDADSELVILRLRQTGANYFGGALRFGADSASAADLSSLAGKIIRIDSAARPKAARTAYRPTTRSSTSPAPVPRYGRWACETRGA